MTTPMAFSQRINSRLDQLTKSERKIADYLQRNFEEAAFFSAAELADRLDLSEATVVRFAQSIGFSGFPELRQCLKDLLMEKVTHAARLRKKLAELSPEAHIFEQVTAMEIEYLTDALRTLLEDEARREAMGRAARRFAEGFSWDASARTMEAFLERHVARPVNVG